MQIVSDKELPDPYNQEFTSRESAHESGIRHSFVYYRLPNFRMTTNLRVTMVKISRESKRKYLEDTSLKQFLGTGGVD
jgi:hypothetical protein